MRIWTLTLMAPCVWLTANTLNGPNDGPARSRAIRLWRKAMCDCCRAGNLPCGDQRLDLIRVRMTARFRGRPPVRDGNAGNLDPTKKAVLDGLGPERNRMWKGELRKFAGWGLIPDDSDKHLESASIVVGEPLPPTVIADHPGLLIVTITELAKPDALF